MPGHATLNAPSVIRVAAYLAKLSSPLAKGAIFEATQAHLTQATGLPTRTLTRALSVLVAAHITEATSRSRWRVLNPIRLAEISNLAPGSENNVAPQDATSGHLEATLTRQANTSHLSATSLATQSNEQSALSTFLERINATLEAINGHLSATSLTQIEMQKTLEQQNTIFAVLEQIKNTLAATNSHSEANTSHIEATNGHIEAISLELASLRSEVASLRSALPPQSPPEETPPRVHPRPGGGMLRAWMQDHQLTGVECATRLGMDISTPTARTNAKKKVSAWVRGDVRPSPELRAKLFDLTNIPPHAWE